MTTPAQPRPERWGLLPLIDLASAAGAAPWAPLLAIGPAFAAGFYALLRIRGLTGAAPFPPVEARGLARLR